MKQNGDTRKKRTPAQILADMAYIEHAVVRGKWQRDIAKELSAIRPYTLSRQQIAYDYRKIQETWKAEMVEEIDAEKRKLLRKLDHQEVELWAAWDKSKLDHTKRNEERTTSGANGTSKKVRTEKETQCGDVAYMEALLKIHERRAKILGLDAPAQIANADGGNVPPMSATHTLIYLPDNGRAADSPNPITGRELS